MPDTTANGTPDPERSTPGPLGTGANTTSRSGDRVAGASEPIVDPRAQRPARPDYGASVLPGEEAAGTAADVDLRYWMQVKYLTTGLVAITAAVMALHFVADKDPNAVILVSACALMFAGALLVLTVPAQVLCSADRRHQAFGLMASGLTAAATLLISVHEDGHVGPFILLYVIAMLIAGIAASPGYVAATGLLSVGGFIWLTSEHGVPVGGEAYVGAALLVLVLLATAWLSSAQERRAERMAVLTDDHAAQVAKVDWMMGATHAGICVSDAEDLITVANEAACAMLGLSWEELIGAPAHDTFHHSHPDGTPFPKDECDVQASLRTGLEGPVSEDVYWRADGTSFDVEANAVPTPDGGVMVAFTDISERLATQRLKDEFMSVVSHELRTPLTSVRGALGLLAGGAGGDLPPEAVRMVTIAASNTDRLSRLINDILDVERIKSGQAVLHPDSFDAATVAVAAVEEMRVMAAEHGVDLRCEGGEVMVHADRDRVQQVIVNLLSNAVKFSEPGSEVVVGAVVDGREARIDVTDHGRGIPPELSEQVFTRFQQVDASDARVMGGVGLGLAICEGIVRQHGGRIWVDSTVGVGSTFSFTLPLASVTAPETGDRSEHAVLAPLPGRNPLAAPVGDRAS